MTKQTTTSKDAANIVSANNESPDQKSEPMGTTCIHDPIFTRMRKYYRDDELIAEMYVCGVCKQDLGFAWGEDNYNDWTENAD